MRPPPSQVLSARPRPITVRPVHRPWSPLRALGAAFVAILFALPLVFMISGSLRPPGLPPPSSPQLVPDPLGLGSYGRAFDLVDLGRYTFNSLVVVALVVPLTVVVASWAGFAIARLGGRSAALLVAVSIAALMVPHDRTHRPALHALSPPRRHGHVGPAGRAGTARDLAALRPPLRGRLPAPAARSLRRVRARVARSLRDLAPRRHAARRARDGRGRGPGVRRELGQRARARSCTCSIPRCTRFPSGCVRSPCSTGRTTPSSSPGASSRRHPCCSHSSSPSVGYRSPGREQNGSLADRVGPRRRHCDARRRVRLVRGGAGAVPRLRRPRGDPGIPPGRRRLRGAVRRRCPARRGERPFRPDRAALDLDRRPARHPTSSS